LNVFFIDDCKKSSNNHLKKYGLIYKKSIDGKTFSEGWAGIKPFHRFRILKIPKPKRSNLVKEYDQIITIFESDLDKVVPVQRGVIKATANGQGIWRNNRLIWGIKAYSRRIDNFDHIVFASCMKSG
jgi:hypothetical protein